MPYSAVGFVLSYAMTVMNTFVGEFVMIQRGMSLLTLFASIAVVSQPFANAQDLSPAYDVKVSLYRPIDETEQTIAQPQLHVADVGVPDNIKNVIQLLLQYHIYADSGALGLVYALNPGLEDARKLAPSQKLYLPQFDVTPEIAAQLETGCLFRIHYDEQLVRKLIGLREQAQHATLALPAFLSIADGDTRAKERLSTCMTSLSSDFEKIANHLTDRDQATNHEILAQVDGEMQLYFERLDRITTVNRSVTQSDINLICSIARDLAIKNGGINITRGRDSYLARPPLAHVVVNTYYEAATRKPAPLLRIYYVPEALQTETTEVKRFSALTSPAQADIPEADYVFWAMKDGNSSPLSERIPIPVRTNGTSTPVTVDLLVKQ